MNLLLAVLAVPLALGVFIALALRPRGKTPTEGELAPDFDLQDQHRHEHRLSDYRGRWVVLFFYPKDQTPGCTKEACDFQRLSVQLKDLNAAVLGISLDDVSSHQDFAAKHTLDYPLLADIDGTVAQRYGVLRGLGKFRFAARRSFIIDPEGRVKRYFGKVSPSEHGEEVVGELKKLKVTS